MNILVIDDSEAAQIAFEQVFTHAGFLVTTAGTADEGLKSIRSKAPDLIVLDVQLPDLLGTHLCEMLKNDPSTRYIPILMCTGNRDAAHGLNHGADDYLVKPCSKDEMLARVNALLRRVEMAEERARDNHNLKRRQELAAKKEAAAASLQEHPPVSADSPHGKLSQGLIFAWASLAFPFKSLAKIDEFPLASTLTPLLMLCLFQTAVRLIGAHPEPWLRAATAGSAGPVCLWAATAIFSSLLISKIPRTASWSNMARVCAAATAPLALRGLLTLLYVAICDGVPTEFSASPLLLSAGLGAGPLTQWLGRFDLFAVWSAAIVAVGARRLGKLTKARFVLIGAGAWSLWIITQEIGRFAVWGP